MLNKSYRFIAVILALSVLFSCLPMSIFALDISNENTGSDIIVEDESLREESVKHFRMPDGSYTAVVYTKPVHRRDSDGVWQDIDNRMDESTVKNKQAYMTSDGRTVFSKKITGDDPTVFELSENGYSIKVSFADGNIKNTTAKLSNHAKKYKPTGADDIETQYKKLKTIDNNTTVSYKNLLGGMTLEYVLSGNDVKENIIINKKTDGYVYSFIYELDGLTAALNEDGSIDLVNENSGEPVGSIPAPYMYDDDGAVSHDVSYTLEDLGDGVYKLSVSANEEWINSSDRAFPVVIDPTMTFHIDSKDTYISSIYPNSNFGDSEKLWVSSAETTFLQFTDLPRLGDYVTITDATLNLHYYYYIDTGSLTVGAYQVTENWNEYSLTWNTAQEMSYEGVSPFYIGTAILPASPFFKSSSTPGSAAINVTSLVQAWFAGMPNYGMAIKYEGGSNSSVILNSKETYTGAYYEIGYTTDRTNYAPVDNGVYFLENKQLEGYVQIDDDSSTDTEGAILELFEFDGASDQKWMLTYLRNGYYKITSLASYKAVTAPSELNEALTQESYQLSNAQLWQITSAGDGLYHIAPRSKSTYRMAAGDGYLENIIGTNGRNVEMREQQSDNQDEWKLTYLGNSYNILQVIYGFSSEEAALINTLYDKVDSKFPNETEMQRAWKCARLLGGIVYGRNPDDNTHNETNGILDSAKDQLEFYAWKDVAGQVFASSEQDYFVNTLGYSKAQYEQLKTVVQQQYANASKPGYALYSDFAHYQMALAARLAYKLNKDGFLSNVGTFCSDEEISYLAGWLGDATISADYGMPRMPNPDYCADLDAENTYRYIVKGCSYSEALSYYFFSFSNSANRATIFLSNIAYDVVCQKVFERLDRDEDKEEDWEDLRTSCPDTYDFLKSLENELETRGDY